MYDGVLRLELPERTEIIEFADNVVIVVVAMTIQAAETSAWIVNAAMEKVVEWLTRTGLNLAHKKTETMLISSRKRVETATIQVGGLVVKLSRTVRMVLIDLLDTEAKEVYEALTDQREGLPACRRQGLKQSARAASMASWQRR